jgi:hypothetical protein
VNGDGVSFDYNNGALENIYTIDADGDGFWVHDNYLDENGDVVIHATFVKAGRQDAAQENDFKYVNDQFRHQFNEYRLKIVVPPLSTLTYSSGAMHMYYLWYLEDTFQDKVLFDPDKKFDIRAVSFDLLVIEPSGNRTLHHRDFGARLYFHSMD